MIKDFLSKYRKTIGVVAGLVVVAAIGIYVGDVTFDQVKDCVFSFNPASVACDALDGTPVAP